MPKDYVEIAAKGHPIMAFWTAAAMGYIYWTNPSSYTLGLTLATIFFGTIAYNELKQLIEMAHKLAGKYSGGRWANQPKTKLIIRLLSEIFTERGLDWKMYTIAANVLIGLGIYLLYLLPELAGDNPDQIALLLFALPLIWVFTIVWSVSDLVSS